MCKFRTYFLVLFTVLFSYQSIVLTLPAQAAGTSDPLSSLPPKKDLLAVTFQGPPQRIQVSPELPEALSTLETTVVPVQSAEEGLAALAFATNVANDALAQNQETAISVSVIDGAAEGSPAAGLKFAGSGTGSISKAVQTANAGTFLSRSAKFVRNTARDQTGETWTLVMSRFLLNGGINALTLAFVERAPYDVAAMSFMSLGLISSSLTFFKKPFRDFLIGGKITNWAFDKFKLDDLFEKVDSQKIGKWIADREIPFSKPDLSTSAWMDSKSIYGLSGRTYPERVRKKVGPLGPNLSRPGGGSLARDASRMSEEWTKWYATEVFFYGSYYGLQILKGYKHFLGAAATAENLVVAAAWAGAGQAPWDLGVGVEFDTYRQKYANDPEALAHIEKVYGRLNCLISVVTTAFGGIQAQHPGAIFALLGIGALGTINYLRTKRNQKLAEEGLFPEAGSGLWSRIWEPKGKADRGGPGFKSSVKEVFCPSTLTIGLHTSPSLDSP